MKTPNSAKPNQAQTNQNSTVNYSAKRNKQAMVKAHLLAGKSITLWESITLYRATQLPKIIERLKYAGLPIETTYHQGNDCTRYARYKLAGGAV